VQTIEVTDLECIVPVRVYMGPTMKHRNDISGDIKSRRISESDVYIKF
jgi:hypothetical protein